MTGKGERRQQRGNERVLPRQGLQVLVVELKITLAVEARSELLARPMVAAGDEILVAPCQVRVY